MSAEPADVGGATSGSGRRTRVGDDQHHSADPRDRDDPVEHLVDAARDLIGAARSVLDALEAVLDDQLDTRAERRRAGERAGERGSDAGDDPLASRPARVRRIDVAE